MCRIINYFGKIIIKFKKLEIFHIIWKLQTSTLFSRRNTSNLNHTPVDILLSTSEVVKKLIQTQISGYISSYISPYLLLICCGIYCCHSLKTEKKWIKRRGNICAYGLSKDSLKLLHSFLSNRWHRIKINKQLSSWLKLIQGVSQGSVQSSSS